VTPPAVGRRSRLARASFCRVTGWAVLLLVCGTRPAVAELTIVDTHGWTFFTDGRVNAFLSQGFGDDFPQPTFNPNVDPSGNPGPQHTVLGSGAPFTAGYWSDQGANGRYFGSRVRSGFLGSILAFGIRRRVSETTEAMSYVSLWGTAESFARDRTQDFGRSTTKTFDMREGWVRFGGPWGALTAGRQSGLLGAISTEIDFLYGHGYGLGLPCVDAFYPACGHIGTGALDPGFAAGFVYASPPVAGLNVSVGLYDPTRLLDAWERTPFPRVEGAVSAERALAKRVRFKLAAEGMYQYMAIVDSPRTNEVWGAAAGGRFEAGPIRLGAAAFRGKGLGIYYALQNEGSTFTTVDRQLRSFTGLYAQAAVVLGREQVSAGAGRVLVDQLPEDKTDATTSWLKSQAGVSLCVYHALTDNVVVGVDYFRFQTNWWGAPNSTRDLTGAIVILPGVLSPERQVINFINAGATFRW
jgi:hypothetical protein